MKREETLFEPTYEFMKKRGYKITKNSKFNEFKSPILIFRAYRDETEIEYVANEECEYDPFFLTTLEVVEREEDEKDMIRSEVKYCESLINKTRTEEDYSDEYIKKILSLKKYL